MDSLFKDQAEGVGKQDALKALVEACSTPGTGLKEDMLAGQLDTLLDSLQLFNSGSVPREQFVRELKDHTLLYQQISQGNMSVATDAALVLSHSLSL